MAFGTALTVAVLATLALGSRELALRLGGGNSAWANAVWTTCAIGRAGRPALGAGPVRRLAGADKTVLIHFAAG